jgi:hypothetical protein
MVRPERLRKLKKKITSSSIEPTTFRFVRYPEPQFNRGNSGYFIGQTERNYENIRPGAVINALHAAQTNAEYRLLHVTMP